MNIVHTAPCQLYMQLFVAGSLVGDGETIIQLNEVGELEWILENYKVCIVLQWLPTLSVHVLELLDKYIVYIYRELKYIGGTS